jgi:hypothetical protein
MCCALLKKAALPSLQAVAHTTTSTASQQDASLGRFCYAKCQGPVPGSGTMHFLHLRAECHALAL